MKLEEIGDSPTHHDTIGGKPYRFGEVPLAGLVELQSWAREHVPNPLDTIKGKLDGFEPDEKAELLRQARRDAEHWPPDPTTETGIGRLLQTEEGQLACLLTALRVHQPETTKALASTVYKALSRESAQRFKQAGKDKAARERVEKQTKARIGRIFAVAYQLATDDDEDESPKGP